jgi:hypothetical protein
LYGFLLAENFGEKLHDVTTPALWLFYLLTRCDQRMLSFQDFFAACSGFWTTERIYHYMADGSLERSYTEYSVNPLSSLEKRQILTPHDQQLDTAAASSEIDYPGFAISFQTRSETGEEVAMSLKALFVPDGQIPFIQNAEIPPAPIAAQVSPDANDGLIQGFYLRDEGYSETGSIAGRFTYQPMRQTLEMTTYYRKSVAVDQMRLIVPNVRLRTIVTYERPQPGEVPTAINLVGFGVERRQSA